MKSRLSFISFAGILSSSIVISFALTACGIYETKNPEGAGNNATVNGLSTSQVTPTTKVSYATVRTLVLEASCKQCHMNGASRGGVSFNDYTSTKSIISDISSTVFQGQPVPMPPAGMSSEQKRVLKQWIDQGSPEQGDALGPAPSATPVVSGSPTATPSSSSTPFPASTPVLTVSYAEVSAHVFIESCQKCHMNGTARGGVALDTYEQVIANLAGVKSTVFDGQPVQMPRKGLPADQKLLLKTWIDLGAKEGVVVVPTSTANPISTPVPVVTPTATPSATPVVVASPSVSPTPDASVTPAPTATPAMSPAGPTPVPSATPVLQATFASLKANVFTAKCLQCHAAGARADDLPLDNYQNMLAAAGFVVPGKPDESSLVMAIQKGSMPPKRANLPPVTADELMVIKTWISQGANP